jgi:hypothetical protein
MLKNQRELFSLRESTSMKNQNEIELYQTALSFTQLHLENYAREAEKQLLDRTK